MGLWNPTSEPSPTPETEFLSAGLHTCFCKLQPDQAKAKVEFVSPYLFWPPPPHPVAPTSQPDKLPARKDPGSPT